MSSNNSNVYTFKARSESDSLNGHIGSRTHSMHVVMFEAQAPLTIDDISARASKHLGRTCNATRNHLGTMLLRGYVVHENGKWRLSTNADYTPEQREKGALGARELMRAWRKAQGKGKQTGARPTRGDGAPEQTNEQAPAPFADVQLAPAAPDESEANAKRAERDGAPLPDMAHDADGAPLSPEALEAQARVLESEANETTGKGKARAKRKARKARKIVIVSEAPAPDVFAAPIEDGNATTGERPSESANDVQSDTNGEQHGADTMIAEGAPDYLGAE